MAHKKGAGSTKNGRDSNAKRLGVKRFGGEKVKAGSILMWVEIYPSSHLSPCFPNFSSRVTTLQTL